jgi:hypothetical protein
LVKGVSEGVGIKGDYHVTKVNLTTPLEPCNSATRGLAKRSVSHLVIDTLLQHSNTTLENCLRSYIGKGIQEKIDSGLENWLSEMRRVSVVFVNLKGFHFQKEDSVDYETTNKVFGMMQKVIFRHEGFVRQFLVDGK